MRNHGFAARSTRLRRALIALVLLAGCHCGAGDAAPDLAPEIVAPQPPPAELVERGRTLIDHFECRRCHVVDDLDELARDRSCVDCHRAILDGSFAARPEDLATWSGHLRHLLVAPRLEHLGDRWDATWIEAFLRTPHDLRPNLEATMPRLAIGDDEARAIAAFLTRERHVPSQTIPIDASRVDAGRAIFTEQKCGRCHAFERPVELDRPVDDAARLAPDLLHARDRVRRDRIVDWLMMPTAIARHTQMPTQGLDANAARDLASYVLFAEIDRPQTEPVAMLPLLERHVTYAEVDAQVFHRTCRHCHADPAFAFDDGGPGNTGGFGFAPRGLDLSAYPNMHVGELVDGTRESIFRIDDSGMPRIVRALRARQLEEAGQLDEGIRGMPLGHSALGPEDLQLVASWVAQGRPRE